MMVYQVHRSVSACCYDVCLQIEMVQPHNNLLCKSGTDFKNVTAITVALPAAADGAAASGVNGHSSGSDAAAARPSFSWQDYPMTSEVPEDPEIQKVSVAASAVLSCALHQVQAHECLSRNGCCSTAPRAGDALVCTS
jgi:hypothetical protein